MDLSIIIVNYNTLKLLQKVLQSIKIYPPSAQYEVFIVDNLSTDGSAEYLNQLKNVDKSYGKYNIIINKYNVGFSKANNQAIKKAKGRYILLLNPDTEVLANTLDKCIKYMDKHINIGILGCKVVLQNGKLDLACRRGFPTLKNSFFKFTGLARLFPKSKYFAGYNLTYLNENKSYPVDSVVGAFMMVRQKTIQQIGMLDEDFFMYGEDIDWCYRAKKAGWEIFYYSEASIIHHKRASSIHSRKALVEFFKSMEIFYKKHYASQYNRFINACVYATIKFIATVKISLNSIGKRRGAF